MALRSAPSCLLLVRPVHPVSPALLVHFIIPALPFLPALAWAQLPPANENYAHTHVKLGTFVSAPEHMAAGGRGRIDSGKALGAAVRGTWHGTKPACL